jgi:hypothetical protein
MATEFLIEAKKPGRRGDVRQSVFARVLIEVQFLSYAR